MAPPPVGAGGAPAGASLAAPEEPLDGDAATPLVGADPLVSTAPAGGADEAALAASEDEVLPAVPLGEATGAVDTEDAVVVEDVPPPASPLPVAAASLSLVPVPATPSPVVVPAGDAAVVAIEEDATGALSATAARRASSDGLPSVR